MTNLIESVARRPAFISLHVVIEEIAQRLEQPTEPIARHVLAYLQGPAEAVPLYLLERGWPQLLPVGGATRAKVREAAQQAMRRGVPLAGLLARSLVELPRERGALLEALAEWWCGTGCTRARRRGAAEVVLSARDATEHLGFESQGAPTAQAASSPAAAAEDGADHDEAAPVPLVEADQLRKDAARFDAACIALYRARQRLEGTHRPMQRLVEKYHLSDGHLRKCIRHAQALLGAKAIEAPVRTVFDLGRASPAAGRRRVA